MPSSIPTPNLCAVIPVTSVAAASELLAAAHGMATMLELRLDYLPTAHLAALKTLLADCRLPTIVCCRAVSEGGYFTGSRSQQRQLLQQAVHMGATLVDVDWLALPELSLDIEPTRWVLSYHDFAQTPTLSELRNLQHAMRALQPYVVKLATHCNHTQDSQRLLQLLAERESCERMIVIGMGAYGQALRVCAPLLGSYVGYGALDGHATAAGQLELHRLQRCYQELTLLGQPLV